jgi:bifunctional non-homologous end joining protein LigD
MDWVKVKWFPADTFAIVGSMPGERSQIAHLMLATEEDGELRYVGAVGTGWTEAEALALKNRLDALALREATVEGVKAKGAVWTAPDLWAKVAYRGLTSGGEPRQASFKGCAREHKRRIRPPSSSLRYPGLAHSLIETFALS